MNDSSSLKRCKNCHRPLLSHSIPRLELCKGELNAKQRLEKLIYRNAEWERNRREELEKELGEENNA